jgi:transcriptional regulator with XRE-family HTH domain
MTAHAKRNKRRHPEEGPRTAAAALEHKPSPLQRLIRRRLRERGWSYGEVARRGGLPRSTVYTLATTPDLARPPRPATVDALGEGLDVPVSAVRAAAIESTGLYYYGQVPAGQQDPAGRETELLAASIEELTPEDRVTWPRWSNHCVPGPARAGGRLAPPLAASADALMSKAIEAESENGL